MRLLVRLYIPESARREGEFKFPCMVIEFVFLRELVIGRSITDDGRRIRKGVVGVMRILSCPTRMMMIVLLFHGSISADDTFLINDGF